MNVVSIDVKLYDVDIGLWEVNEEIRNNYIFPLGELNVTFWALAVLGKYIEASGIDQSWIQGGLYTACTVSKILQGKRILQGLGSPYVNFINILSTVF